MAILCKLTQSILKDAATHGIPISQLEDFARDVEKTQSVSQFDQFPPPCLVKKKKFGYKNRVICVQKHVGDHSVVVFLRIILHGGSERNDYTDFQRNPAEWAGRFYDKEFSNGELEAWVDERTRVDLPPKPPELDPSEAAFLWTNATVHDDLDTIVCETHDWVTSMRDQRLESRRIRLPELIVQGIEGPANEVRVIQSTSDPRLCLLCYFDRKTDHLLLLDVKYDVPGDELIRLQSTWAKKTVALDLTKLLQLSARGYPILICYDEDMWLNAESEDQANLALSPEETEIIRGCKASSGNLEGGLPLFINGRAGSGKSTVLQYLFAEYVRRWDHVLDASSQYKPLYFASNDTLLSVAKRTVSDLLNTNSEHLLVERQLSTSCKDQIDSLFQNTRTFFMSLLDENGRIQFASDNYVSYSIFRRKWTERFGNEPKALKEYGPQVSWHVIRGLIKGLSVETELERDEYFDLPREERTVSQQSYERVFDRVWRAWYEPARKSGLLWDSQDLVRYLLDNNLFQANHIAIFCDEAQDFTRIELEALYRASLYGRRTIEPDHISRIPFVFAGDPFQTLNPTGFRWESVRAAFTERIMASLSRFNTRVEVPQLHYKELTFNYRSATPIVNLCNSIQALRAALFDHRSLRPQAAWQADRSLGCLPTFFEFRDVDMENAIRQQSDLVIIVPCEEDDEADYVARNPYLRSLVSHNEHGVPQNVLSAAKAKGLEFKRVLLFGWAERAEATKLASLMKTADAKLISSEDRLELEYFMNNLYVAASRAQRRLFVVDPLASRDAFWWFATEPSNIHRFVASLPRSEEWVPSLGVLSKGVAENFSEDHDDPTKLAAQFENEGMAKQDPYLLRQAVYHYERIGVKRKADTCSANAAYFEGRFAEAGNHFASAGNIEKAIQVFWQGEYLSNIVELSNSHQDYSRLPECRLAALLCSREFGIRETASLFDELVERADEDSRLRSKIVGASWGPKLNRVLKQAADGLATNKLKLTQEDAIRLCAALDQLEKRGVHWDNFTRAQVHFHADDHERVLKLVKDESHELSKSSRLKLAIRRREAGEVMITSDILLIAEDSFRSERFIEAIDEFAAAQSVIRVLDCLSAILKTNNSQQSEAFKKTIATLVESGDWSDISTLFVNLEPALGRWSKKEKERLRELINTEKLVATTLIPSIAKQTQLLEILDTSTRDRLAAFLRDEFIGRGISANLRGAVDMKLLGQAIENLGRDIDALKFYENWRRNSSMKNREHAEKRWISVKLRQAEREEREGKTHKAREYREEAKELLLKNNWTEESLAETAVARHDSGNNNIHRDHVLSLTEGRKEFFDFVIEGFLTKKRITVTRKQSDGDVIQIGLIRDQISTLLSYDYLESGSLKVAEWGLEISWLDNSIVLKYNSCSLTVQE